jgi:uncharacterized Zn-finger protein
MHYRPVCGVTTVEWSPDSLCLAMGATFGGFHLLRAENVMPGAPVVTAWRWQTGDTVHVGCLLCRGWSEVKSEALGNEIDCPKCGKRLKLNPFTINADWGQVEVAWRLPVVTAWRWPIPRWKLWRRRQYETRFGCPLCQTWSELPSGALGKEIDCPKCGKRLKLNPFTVEADWRQVAKAWHGGREW